MCFKSVLIMIKNALCCWWQWSWCATCRREKRTCRTVLVGRVVVVVNLAIVDIHAVYGWPCMRWLSMRTSVKYTVCSIVIIITIIIIIVDLYSAIRSYLQRHCMSEWVSEWTNKWMDVCACVKLTGNTWLPTSSFLSNKYQGGFWQLCYKPGGTKNVPNIRIRYAAE